MHDDSNYGTQHMYLHQLICDLNRCGSDVRDVVP